MERGNLQNLDASCGHEPESKVGMARCAVRAAFSGAMVVTADLVGPPVPPATTRAGTPRRGVPTNNWFMGRGNLQNLDASCGHELFMDAAASWTAATERSAVAAFKAVGHRCRSGPLASGGSQSGDSLRSSPQSKTWRQCGCFMGSKG